MKKILLVAAMAAGSLAAYSAVAPYDGQQALTSARADIQNWMSYLPDNMFVAHVSIPGTHDTATGEGWATTGSLPLSMSTTQVAKIDEQLAAGVRAFDFRPGLSNDGKLTCNHGAHQTVLTMEEAMTKLTDYLDAHKKEFFVIHLFRGNVPRYGDTVSLGKNDRESQDLFKQLLEDLLNSGKFADYIVDYDPMLKVSDIRGKMVIFRRDRIDHVNIAKAGNLNGWPSDKDAWNKDIYATVFNATNMNKNGIVQVTDISSPKNETELNTELSSLTDLYNYTCTQTRPNDIDEPNKYKPFWSMLFTAGEYTSGTKGYLTNATHTNPHYTNLIKNTEKKGPAGIVFADWVLVDSHNYNNVDYPTMGVELIPTILENNFAYAADFILDDEKFTGAAPSESKLESCAHFMRNVGTGELLCAGTTWGTHATLGKTGIRVTPIHDNITDRYMLSTTFGAFIGIAGEYYVDQVATQYALEEAVPGKYYLTHMVDGKKTAMTAVAHNQPMFVDGSVNFVNPTDFSDGDTMQQWEFIPVDEYLAEAAKVATEDNPSDVTFMIRGNRFDANDKDNNEWYLKDNGSSAKMTIAGTNEWNDKDLLCRVATTSATAKYNKFILANNVTGLPEGTYSFSANVATSTLDIPMTVGGVNVDLTEAKQDNAALSAADALKLFRGDDKDKYTVKAEGIKVGNDGKLEIKLDNAEGIASKYSICLDNMKLYYHGNKTSGVAAVEMEADTVVDVYSISGVALRNGVKASEATADLEKGIYILKGAQTTRKVVVK